MTEWKRDPEYERIAHARMKVLMKQTGIGTGAPFPEAWAYGDDLRALVGREPVSPIIAREPDLRWHISVNGGDRLPTWLQMTSAAHTLRPGICFVIGVPPESWWMADIDSGKFVLHLWELRDHNLEASWMAQRMPGGRKPS